MKWNNVHFSTFFHWMQLGLKGELKNTRSIYSKILSLNVMKTVFAHQYIFFQAVKNFFLAGLFTLKTNVYFTLHQKHARFLKTIQKQPCLPTWQAPTPPLLKLKVRSGKGVHLPRTSLHNACNLVCMGSSGKSCYLKWISHVINSKLIRFLTAHWKGCKNANCDL